MNKIFVTGCAGFIGSNLVDKLLIDNSVVGWDNFSTGQKRFLDSALKNPKFKLVVGDNLNLKSLTSAMSGCDMVYHLAANADVRFGLDHPFKDLEQNTIATFNVLEAMRANGIKKIVFSSTGSVYGDSKIIPTPEDVSFPIQTSLYGTSKVACEGLISSYCEGYGMKGYIFRFVSILGERYTHGHVFDFYKQLIAHPDYLDILGDGTQKKSYLYVKDCVDAMICATKYEESNIQIYNLGTNEYIRVSQSANFICKILGLTPEFRFQGGNRGWVGDNPFVFLDTSRIRNLGWLPLLSIEESVGKTVNWLKQNTWIYDYRE
jgi:UDP-glucose 4-epimerase